MKMCLPRTKSQKIEFNCENDQSVFLLHPDTRSNTLNELVCVSCFKTQFLFSCKEGKSCQK